MENHLAIQLKRILKAVKFDRLYFYLRANSYVNKVTVPVEKDLSTLRPLQDELDQAGVEIVKITMTPGALIQNYETRQSLIFPDAERQETAINYLEKGYHGIALVRGNHVSGDIWYTSADPHKEGAVHPDLKWLKIACGPKDAYAFDMYLHPDRRGRNSANMLQNGILHEIGKHGYTRALGYFWAENIPALWVHRTLQWSELKRVKVTRLLCFHHSHVSIVGKRKERSRWLYFRN